MTSLYHHRNHQELTHQEKENTIQFHHQHHHQILLLFLRTTTYTIKQFFSYIKRRFTCISYHQRKYTKKKQPVFSNVDEPIVITTTTKTNNIDVKKSPQLKNGTVENRFDCPSCDASFKVKGYLTRHLKKHSTSKAFECPFSITMVFMEVNVIQQVDSVGGTLSKFI